MDNSYDLIVIGGGIAGIEAACKVAKGGQKVALIERGALGGTCLNAGCIPAKTLLNSAKVLATVKNCAKYGVKLGSSQPDAAADAVLDPKAVGERKIRILRKLGAGVKIRLTDAGVTVIPATVLITGRASNGAFTLSASNPAGLQTNLECKNLIIATGSRPVAPPIDGLSDAMQKGYALFAEHALNLDYIPQNIAIIGAGAIGLEFAAYYNAAGSAVTVIDSLNKIGGAQDSEICAALQKNMEKKGVKFLLNARVQTVDPVNKFILVGIDAHIAPPVQADAVLVAAGRRPNAENLGLETIGVRMERGAVSADDYMRTNIEGVYAAGDVCGRAMLAHVAQAHGSACADQVLGRKKPFSHGAPIPAVIYTNPEAAGVGLTTQNSPEAQCGSITLPMQYSGRFVAENSDQDGIAKLIFLHLGSAPENDILGGAHFLGNSSSEFVFAASLLLGKTAGEISNLIFPHPTVCEIIRDCAEKYIEK